MRSIRLRRMHILTSATTLLTAFALAACGGGGSGSAGASGAPEKVPPIKIAIAGGFVDFSAIFLAEADGLFAKHGVDVTLQQNTGSNTLNYVVSNQVDIAIYTAPIALTAALQGKPTTVI